MTEAQQDPLVLLWSWRHHCLDVSAHDNIQQAVSLAHYLEDTGEGNPELVEIFDGASYRVLHVDDIDREYPRPPNPKPAAPQYVVRLAAPGHPEHSAAWDWAPTAEEAEIMATEARLRFGAERVSVQAPRHGKGTG